MPLVDIELPSLLTSLVHLPAVIPLEAPSLSEALDELIRLHPDLEVHLFTQDHELRPHVLCLHNGANSRWSDAGQVSLQSGDRITIMQAVSGG